MRFSRSTRSERTLSVEITPMIDVVFLLIIFFMAAARFAQDTRAELDLPRERGEQQEKSDEAGVTINIDARGAIIVGSTELELEELMRLVQGEITRLPGRDPARLKLMIRADRDLDARTLNTVLERLQGIGVGGARLATEVP